MGLFKKARPEPDYKTAWEQARRTLVLIADAGQCPASRRLARNMVAGLDAYVNGEPLPIAPIVEDYE